MNIDPIPPDLPPEDIPEDDSPQPTTTLPYPVKLVYDS